MPTPLIEVFSDRLSSPMSKQINLRIPTALLEEIDVMAEEIGESRSEFLRSAAAERMGYLRRERDDEAAEEDE